MQTYVERDVRMWTKLKDLRLFQRLLTLLAGRVGQVLNYTSLGNGSPVRAKTTTSLEQMRWSLFDRILFAVRHR